MDERSNQTSEELDELALQDQAEEAENDDEQEVVEQEEEEAIGDETENADDEQPEEVEEVDDNYVIAIERNGKQEELSIADIEKLLYIRDKEQELQEKENTILQYNALLNAVANDHFLNRVVSYRLGGYDPATIVKFLYNYFMENNYFDEQQNASDDPQSRLEKEVTELKTRMEYERRYQENTQALLREYYNTISEEPITDNKLASEIAQEVAKVVAEMVGESPDKVLYSQRVTPAIARAAWREVAERYPQIKKKSTGQSGQTVKTTKKIVVKKRGDSSKQPPRQLPANVGIRSGASINRSSEVLTYSPENARRQLQKLLNGK